MLNVTDQRVEDGVQLAVVVEMTGAGASGLDDDSQRERLRASFRIERYMLRHTVISDQKVVRRESKNYLACFGGRQDWHHHQRGAHG